MNAAEIVGIVLASLGALSGLNYCLMRLAIQAEVAQLKSEMSDKYVTAHTCDAIRKDCKELRKAMAGRLAAEAVAGDSPQT